MISHYKDKKVVVIGLARSGIAAARLLREAGAEVFVTDSSSNDKLKEPAKDSIRDGIKVELGGHTIDFIRDKDLVVVSPGVSDKSQAIIWANEFKIPIISEIELAWQNCSAKVIAVTGTNGKTTVTSLIAEVLKVSGKKSYALGNIGTPFSLEAVNLKPTDFVSLEVSSFQLERIVKFKPQVALILNLTPDHLDRYKDMSEYLSAKKRVFLNQDQNDYLVLNYDDPALRALAKEAKARVVFFSSQDNPRNLNPNQLAVMAVARVLGIAENTCGEVFRNFKGVEHRLEQVRVLKDIEFINDSKATNVDSAVWALRSTSRQAIMIAGGRDKNIDYGAISDLVKKKVKLLVLIGEAKEKIRSALGGIVPIKEALTLDEAVNLSYAQAKGGDCVLFSPMCSSFDMFKNYEHRGRVFKEIVNKLI
mgnify:CR=1 FL=1